MRRSVVGPGFLFVAVDFHINGFVHEADLPKHGALSRLLLQRALAKLSTFFSHHVLRWGLFVKLNWCTTCFSCSVTRAEGGCHATVEVVGLLVTLSLHCNTHTHTLFFCYIDSMYSQSMESFARHRKLEG